MQIEDLYTIIVTDRHTECRDFYVRWFGFTVVFEATWFIYLATAGAPRFGIAFMAPDHPSVPPGPERFNGKGVLVTLQVGDAAAEFSRIEAAGIPIAHPLRDEPWGQRRFAVSDPSGAWVDIVEQIEPESGFWERYAV